MCVCFTVALRSLKRNSRRLKLLTGVFFLEGEVQQCNAEVKLMLATGFSSEHHVSIHARSWIFIRPRFLSLYLSRRSGGTLRAADVVEGTLQLGGSSHLHPPEFRGPWHKVLLAKFILTAVQGWKKEE